MAARVDNINTKILSLCREQIGLKISDVQKKVKKIVEIEAGEQKPTFNQLNILSDLYKVPRWVFISEHLPKKYRLDEAIPVFRKSKDEVFNDHKVRGVTAKVERLRNLIIELLDDMGEKITPFNPPKLKNNMPINSSVKLVRKWLNTKEEENLEFNEWKELFEEKGIFVFMTSKYKGWSNVDKKIFRGLAIYHSVLPVIIIDDSDSNKAQSFTLFHELWHLLNRESMIDSWKRIEKRCDEFAGSFLMPKEIFPFDSVTSLSDIKKVAKKFKVSSYACLVRMKQLRIIDNAAYIDFEKELKNEYQKLQKRLKENTGGPPRKKVQEILNQYGRLYTKVLYQAYHNEEIGLNKLCQLCEFKRPSYAIELERHLL